VIDHVPEGAVEPQRDGHMQYAGTISLPEDLFEQVLIATARSLKVHGFKKIFFIGDSGGNQKAQENVARLLTQEWRNEGMVIAHIGAYYGANGQFEYLRKAGYSEADIGYHAGMRDTSELLFADPSAVHRNFVLNPQGTSSGVSGNPNKASAEIGEKMIELKVKAALKEIKGLLKEENYQTSSAAVAAVIR